MKKSALTLPLWTALAIMLYALQAESAETPGLPALAKIIVLVQQEEIYPYDSHPLQHRQVAATTNCLNACSYVNEALTTCADDACFCPAVTVGASTCSECYATVNVTAASVWSSVIGICSSEFPGVTATATLGTPTTTTSAPSFPAACTGQCFVISQALVSCTDDFCFCPTATAFGALCSQCLTGVNITQADDIGSAMSICSSEFGITTGSATAGSAHALTFGTPTTSFNALTEFDTPTSTTSSTTFLGTGANSSTSATTSPSSSSSGLSKGAIGGIVGGFFALLVIGAVILFCCIRKPKRRDPRSSSEQDPPYPPAAPQDYLPPDYPPPKQYEAGVENYYPPKQMETSTESVSAAEVNDVPSGRLRYLDEDEGLRVPEPQGPAGGRLFNG